MDPDACYARLLAAVARRNGPGACAAIGDLVRWLGRGGFVPAQLQADADARGRSVWDHLYELRREAATAARTAKPR
jgi:hypothetical protein